MTTPSATERASIELMAFSGALLAITARRDTVVGTRAGLAIDEEVVEEARLLAKFIVQEAAVIEARYRDTKK